MDIPITRHRFTVHDLDRMLTVGIIADGRRIELLGGDLVEKVVISPENYYCVARLGTMLIAATKPPEMVAVRGPLRLSMRNQPEPDVAIIRVATTQVLPGPADTLLVLEALDSARQRDRHVKLPLYAAAGILEAWIVDLVAERIERYTEPVGGTYQIVDPSRRGERIESTVLPGLILDVDAVLGPPGADTDEASAGGGGENG